LPWLLTELSGTCVYPGYGSGQARFLDAADDTPQGGVLVASAIEPPDVPAIFDCTALVLESGDLISHAAITARELGVPALANVINATHVIKPGDRLFVDSERIRILRSSAKHESCPLCEGSPCIEVLKGEFLRAVEDMFPVVRHHTLIVPRRHLTDISQLSTAEWLEHGSLLNELRGRLQEMSGSADINVALNLGPAAGQTISHLHWHVLPRITGDDEDARGGLRRLLAHPFRPYPEPA
jgi:diadenosine tetraphosphate (Ap4A) HIT family hydrolase/phosphohistidine swiveling domain-containing protein